MVSNPGKSPEVRKNHLLSILFKIIERLLLKLLKPIIINKKLILEHQFGFKQGHGNYRESTHCCENLLLIQSIIHAVCSLQLFISCYYELKILQDIIRKPMYLYERELLLRLTA